MGRTSLIILAALATVAWPACGQKYTVDFDPSFDFSGLKTYEWKTHPVMEANPEIAQTAIAGEIVMSEGNEILMSRGYVPDEFEPDFYIAFFVKGKENVEATNFGTSWYYGPGTYWGSYNTIYKKFMDGTLVIDIVDAKSKQLVWRAYNHDKVSNWKKRDKNISKAVEKSFKKFPPKKKK